MGKAQLYAMTKAAAAATIGEELSRGGMGGDKAKAQRREQQRLHKCISRAHEQWDRLRRGGFLGLPEIEAAQGGDTVADWILGRCGDSGEDDDDAGPESVAHLNGADNEAKKRAVIAVGCVCPGASFSREANAHLFCWRRLITTLHARPPGGKSQPWSSASSAQRRRSRCGGTRTCPTLRGRWASEWTCSKRRWRS